MREGNRSATTDHDRVSIFKYNLNNSAEGEKNGEVRMRGQDNKEAPVNHGTE